MNDLPQLIFNLSVIAIGPAYWFWLKRSKQTETSISTKRVTYPAIIGDYIEAEDRTFNGIQVTLMDELPQIYLDSHGDSKIHGPRYTYSNDQRLNLEGDFDTYFQLFAPKKYHVLVLSIITPDIMQTLMKVDEKYDVEVRGNKLNIISYHRVGRNAKKLRQLKRIAIQITEEIEHKLNSWTKEDQLEARRARLNYSQDEAVRLFGRYYALGPFTVAVCAIVALILFLISLTIADPDSAAKLGLKFFALMCFPGIPVMIWSTRKYSIK
jgi:hypothetical protein